MASLFTIAALTIDSPTPLTTHEAFLVECRALVAESSGALRVVEIGKSRAGRALLALEFAGRRDAGEDADERQVLIVGGLEGHRPASALVAMALAEQLVRANAQSSAGRRPRITIIPRANPDGLAAWHELPLLPRSGNAAPFDDDRDWLIDEDSPEDIDADGRVLRMRVRHPDGKLCADPAEPRLLRAPRPNSGETPEYLELAEGIDNDGDGIVNEDGIGGATMARNFPHDWEDHVAASGQHPLAEPEARAIAEYLLAAPQTALVLVLSEFDCVTREPEAGAGGASAGGEDGARGRGGFGGPRGVMTKLQANDSSAYQLLAEGLRTALSLTREKEKSQFPRGDLTGYCYFQLGIPALSLPVWTKPRSSDEGRTGKPDDKSDAERVPKEAGEQEQTPASRGERKNESKSDGKVDGGSRADSALAVDLAWLAFADGHPELGGFAPWRRFTHPRYGEVEIGGFVPGFREFPPAVEVTRLAAGLQKFLARVPELLPRLAITQLIAEELGDGVFRVEALIYNAGQLPAQLAQAALNGHVREPAARLALEAGQLLTGSPRQRLGALAPRGRRSVEWWISSRRGAHITLRIESEFGGSVERTLQLGTRQESF
ncbi:MAG: M14 family zinc carboxypeptidase [Planctomycetota bacterium]